MHFVVVMEIHLAVDAYFEAFDSTIINIEFVVPLVKFSADARRFSVKEARG